VATFSRRDIASSGEADDRRPEDPNVSSQQVEKSLHSTFDSLIQRHRSLPLKRTERRRRAPGCRRKNTPCAGTSARGVRVNVFLTKQELNHGSLRGRCAPRRGGPSALVFPPGVTVSSTIHEGGIWRREAIGQSTHPYSCAGAKRKMAESTARPAGRVGRRYNWLLVRSNSSTQQAGARRTEK